MQYIDETPFLELERQFHEQVNALTPEQRERYDTLSLAHPTWMPLDILARMEELGMLQTPTARVPDAR